MDWDTLNKTIIAVMTVATIIAGAGVGLMVGSIRTLRDTAGDLRSRVTDLESERTRDKAELVEARAENKLLTSMIQGKVEWTALTDLLESHHTEAIQQWTRTDAHLVKIEESIDRTLKAIEEAVKTTQKSIAEAARGES